MYFGGDSIDAIKIGKAISYLRKKVGYTQRELANRLGVSDKAVSKWERGLGLPDTAIIGKIAIILDTDTDSLLAGDIIHHNNDWKGLLIINDNTHKVTVGTMIYDKPVANFILGYFMLMGIRIITIVCGDENKYFFLNEYGNGEKLGIQLTYEKSIVNVCYKEDDSNVMVVSGLSVIYGVDQTRFFQKAMLNRTRTTVLALPKKRVDSPHKLYFDSEKKIVTSEDGEKLWTQYDYYQIPIAFCPAYVVNQMKFSLHDENAYYPVEFDSDMYTVILDRGFVEIPLSDWDSVNDASEFVKIVQKACGMQIYCIAEIAWRRGLISHDQFLQLGYEKKGTPYGDYILELAESKR